MLQEKQHRGRRLSSRMFRYFSKCPRNGLHLIKAKIEVTTPGSEVSESGGIETNSSRECGEWSYQKLCVIMFF